MELFERIANRISFGATPEDIRASLIGEYTDEVIYLNWVAARCMLVRQTTPVPTFTPEEQAVLARVIEAADKGQPVVACRDVYPTAYQLGRKGYLNEARFGSFGLNPDTDMIVRRAMNQPV